MPGKEISLPTPYTSRWFFLKTLGIDPEKLSNNRFDLDDTNELQISEIRKSITESTVSTSLEKDALIKSWEDVEIKFRALTNKEEIYGWAGNDEEENSTESPRFYPSLLVPRRKKKNTLRNQLTSVNALNTYLGLNFGYIVVPLFTAENWHEHWLKHTGTVSVDIDAENADYLGGLTLAVAIVTPWAAIPIAFYVLLTLLNARMEAQKNIVINEMRNQYLETLYQARLKCNAIDYQITQNEISQEDFDKDHAALIDFNKKYLMLDPPKKFFRAALVLGILCASIFPVSWIVLVGVIVTSLLLTKLDHAAQKTDINQDMEIKKLQWELLRVKRLYIKKLEEQLGINFDDIEKQQAPTFVLDNDYIYTDHGFTGLGMNSGYMAFSIITLLALHEILLGASFAGANFVLFGLPAICTVLIGVYHAMQNHKLYKFYESEINRLSNENVNLQEHIEQFTRPGGKFYDESMKYYPGAIQFNFDLTSPLSAQSKFSKKMMEAIKKVIRPAQFLGLFGVFAFLALSGGWGIVAIIAIGIIALGIGYADYKTKEYKESLESKIHKLKDDQSFLLEKKGVLLNQYKLVQSKDSASTESLLKSGPTGAITIPSDSTGKNPHIISTKKINFLGGSSLDGDNEEQSSPGKDDKEIIEGSILTVGEYLGPPSKYALAGFC